MRLETQRRNQVLVRGSGHQPASKLLVPPACRESIRYFEPAAVISGAMIATHARALALMSGRVLTCGSALLLYTVGLNTIDPAVFCQGSIDEIVKPTFRQLPIFSVCNPNRRLPPAILKPLTVRRSVRNSNTQLLTLSNSTKYYWYSLLIPYMFYFIYICVHSLSHR
jgi:hypothetical protein